MSYRYVDRYVYVEARLLLGTYLGAGALSARMGVRQRAAALVAAALSTLVGLGDGSGDALSPTSQAPNRSEHPTTSRGETKEASKPCSPQES